MQKNKQNKPPHAGKANAKKTMNHRVNEQAKSDYGFRHGDSFLLFLTFSLLTRMKPVQTRNILSDWLAVSGMATANRLRRQKMLGRGFYSAGEPALALVWQVQRAD